VPCPACPAWPACSWGSWSGCVFMSGLSSWHGGGCSSRAVRLRGCVPMLWVGG